MSAYTLTAASEQTFRDNSFGPKENWVLDLRSLGTTEARLVIAQPKVFSGP